MPKIVLQPVTRIEGHAKVIIQLDNAGEVETARVCIPSLRGFEKFVVGRPIEEMPRIVTRICGVCPWAHHLAASKACDAVSGIDIPPPAKKLRELALLCHFIHSHLLHFFVLSGPDLLDGKSKERPANGLVDILRRFPDIVQPALRARHTGQMMASILGGRGIHPDVSVPGGWSKPLGPVDRARLQEMGQQCLEFAKTALDFAKERVFPTLLQGDSPPEIATSFLGTVNNGTLSLYDGDLRLMAANGACHDFAASAYSQYVEEFSDPDSYGRLAFVKTGIIDELVNNEAPKHIYRANSLARLNVCDRIDTPEAQSELEDFRRLFGRPAQAVNLYHWARLIETLYAAERAVDLLADPNIIEPVARIPVEPRAGRGIGSVEAPRGTLIHEYTTDSNGIILTANIIVGTTHNNAAINCSVRKVAQSVLSNGGSTDNLVSEIGRVVRAYDP